MTRAEDIVAAEMLRVDFLGLIFVHSSPRCVTRDEARMLRPSIQHARVVGVFDDHSPNEINDIASDLALDFVQLHGVPNRALIEKIHVPVLQAFRGIPDVALLESFLECCPFILLDKVEGESTIDFVAVAALPLVVREKLFLAGGLTPENVRSAVERIHPYAVDVARGIESGPGEKSYDRMLAFSHALS